MSLCLIEFRNQFFVIKKIDLYIYCYLKLYRELYTRRLYITMNNITESEDIPKFILDQEFCQKYENVNPFENELGSYVYTKTYSRIKEDGSKEKWIDTVTRVVNGVYDIQKKHIISSHLPWDDDKAQRSAQEMFDRIFYMKFLPPGRGLWAMGTSILEKLKSGSPLNNCAFVSTKNIKTDLSDPFCFLMDNSMLGCGVGFDVAGAGTITIYAPDDTQPITHVISDNREGWVECLRLLLESYFIENKIRIEFDYSQIRPKGAPIKTFGGTAPGHECLEKMVNEVRIILDKNINKPITTRTIVDIMNVVGVCVVSGNIRRSAEIAFGNHDNQEFIDLKNYSKNPDRMSHGWMSNNSILAEFGMDYRKISEYIIYNGEPGLAWLENMRNYGRMCDEPNHVDYRVEGGNPCLEQSLESYEMCNLVESLPSKHDTLEDFLVTLKYAYLYAKTVTLCNTHWKQTNRIMMRNRRIGCSLTGIANFLSKHTIDEFKNWCNAGYKTIRYYDTVYSEWFCVPKSIKVTSVKPSGTISLLANVTPGMHYPISQWYIRRVRISVTSGYVEKFRQLGYHVEPDVMDKDNTYVVEFPINIGDGIRTIKHVSMWEQLSLAAFLQCYWADNQVSSTISFNPVTEGLHIANALNYFQYKLKGVSFLPIDNTSYKQMPYEEITHEHYEEIVSKIKSSDNSIHVEDKTDGSNDRYCDNDKCTLKFN